MTTETKEQAEEVRRWQMEVHRGRRTREFIRSSFWKLYWEPELMKKRYLKSPEGLPAGALWKPGCGYGMEKTAMGSAFNGGRYEEVLDNFTLINLWLRLGEEAEEKLKQRGISV